MSSPPPEAAAERPPEAQVDDAAPEGDGASMTFTEHLEELRDRLMVCMLAVGSGCIASLYFSREIFDVLMRPLLDLLPPGQRQLNFVGLTEPFIVYLKVGLVVGLFSASPIILGQFWRFVAPGLYSHEKRLAGPFAVIGSALFIGGASFGYFMVFPVAFKFFLSIAGEEVRALPTVGHYLTLTTRLLLAFGLAFELPIFVFMANRAGFVSAAQLAEYRKYAFLGSFVVAAAITPPDVVSQMMLALPLFVLYEASIWAVRIAGRRDDPAPLDEVATEQGIR